MRCRRVQGLLRDGPFWLRVGRGDLTSVLAENRWRSVLLQSYRILFSWRLSVVRAFKWSRDFRLGAVVWLALILLNVTVNTQLHCCALRMMKTAFVSVVRLVVLRMMRLRNRRFWDARANKETQLVWQYRACLLGTTQLKSVCTIRSRSGFLVGDGLWEDGHWCKCRVRILDRRGADVSG